MRMMVAAALLALTACGPEAETVAQAESTPPALEAVALPQSDGAGNRLEAMTQIGERYCSTTGGWCVNTQAGGLVVSHGNGSTAFDVPSGEAPAPEIWPNIIVSNERAFVGAITGTEQMYSGGGGSAQHLTLYEVANGEAREVARLPYSGSLMIRACFAEEDQQRRLEACHDQYEFVSRVRLDETVTSGEPRIVLETAAATFPGRVTRTEDSAERGQLTEADLVWAHDDVCSFRRTFSRSTAGPYAPDADLPACSDYLEP